MCLLIVRLEIEDKTKKRGLLKLDLVKTARQELAFSYESH